MVDLAGTALPNIAENAGGPHGVKYGVTKDYVLRLEVVIPSGDVVRLGGKQIKNVTGYNLVQLFVGSEGTLGVITEATLRLLPKPPAKKTMLAIFDRLDGAAEAVSGIMAGGVIPATLEIMGTAARARPARAPGLRHRPGSAL